MFTKVPFCNSAKVGILHGDLLARTVILWWAPYCCDVPSVTCIPAVAGIPDVAVVPVAVAVAIADLPAVTNLSSFVNFPAGGVPANPVFCLWLNFLLLRPCYCWRPITCYGFLLLLSSLFLL